MILSSGQVRVPGRDPHRERVANSLHIPWTPVNILVLIAAVLSGGLKHHSGTGS